MQQTAEPTTPQNRRPIGTRSVSRRVKFIDWAAGLLIRASGVSIIAVVALIFVFLAIETIPLFRGARQNVVFENRLPGAPSTDRMLGLGINEYESHVYYIDAERASVRFARLGGDAAEAVELPLEGVAPGQITAVYRTPSREGLVVGLSDGRIAVFQAKFAIAYSAEGKRQVKPGIARVGTIPAAAARPIVRVHASQNPTGDFIIAAANDEGRVFTAKLAEGEPAEDPQPVGGGLEGGITGLAIDADANKLFIATDARRLYHYYLADNRETPYRVYSPTSPITAMDFVIGDVSLLLGFEDGRVESWFGVREKATDTLRPMHRIHVFRRMGAAVTAIQPSGRDKGFVVGAADGGLAVDFTTSERTLLTSRMKAGIERIAYSPKLTAVVALARDGTVRVESVDNPHPEVSLKTLFGKVHYEGYDAPEFIWQSSGSDNFEQKLSLVPLAVGTLKGAFYGLLFAIPIAVFAALYTSQFMAPALRSYLKPTVEIMAALPSVVIGFLAGLWLAPKLEQVMVGTLLTLVTVPLVVSIGAFVWTTLPHEIRRRVPSGYELLLIVPLALFGFALGEWLGPWLEAATMGGNYRQWVFDTFGEQFEQRNSIVVGIAMGFAVIPIIFTISEDAFSNVPQALRSASYALGASRWQTAARVVLPTASPGVFSAVMIGFGRAVGETMIVLMATGNTPVLSFSPFNGMRTLAANTAVEIPEAPVGGTLYRVLFVAALLLFALTFACNTVAEVVRQRLRRKYQSL